MQATTLCKIQLSCKGIFSRNWMNLSIRRRIVLRWKSKLSLTILTIISLTPINRVLRIIIIPRLISRQPCKQLSIIRIIIMQLQVDHRLYCNHIRFSQVGNQAVTTLQVCAQHWRISPSQAAAIVASLRSISLNYSENISFNPFIPCNSLRHLSQHLSMSFNRGKYICPYILRTLVKQAEWRKGREDIRIC